MLKSIIICTFTIPYSLLPGMLSFARLKDKRIYKKKINKKYECFIYWDILAILGMMLYCIKLV